jgi:hypothetical protein
VRGAYDEVAGSAQSAWGSAKDAAKDMADSGSMPDLSRLRDDIVKLTQTVSDLAQKQVASSGDQVAGVVGAAGDSCRSRWAACRRQALGKAVWARKRTSQKGRARPARQAGLSEQQRSPADIYDQ